MWMSRIELIIVGAGSDFVALLSGAMWMAHGFRGAEGGGHHIERANIRDLKFDLVLRGGYHGRQDLKPDPVRQQELNGVSIW